MKIAKRIAMGLAILLALPFVAALFLKKSFVIERELTINRPKQEVFEYIKQLKNQEKYSKWTMMDPKAKITYRGTDGAVGSIMAWESDNPDVGKGEQEIKKIVDGERMDVEIRIREPFQSTDPAYTATETISDQKTKVKSVYFGKMPYPMNLLCLFVEDKIGQDMQTNLTNLKNVLEKP